MNSYEVCNGCCMDTYPFIPQMYILSTSDSRINPLFGFSLLSFYSTSPEFPNNNGTVFPATNPPSLPLQPNDDFDGYSPSLHAENNNNNNINSFDNKPGKKPQKRRSSEMIVSTPTLTPFIQGTVPPSRSSSRFWLLFWSSFNIVVSNPIIISDRMLVLPLNLNLWIRGLGFPNSTNTRILIIYGR